MGLQLFVDWRPVFSKIMLLTHHIRCQAWVIVSEVKSGNWGVGGNALGLYEIRKIISSQ
jgi:hypothetical protein